MGSPICASKNATFFSISVVVVSVGRRMCAIATAWPVPCCAMSRACKERPRLGSARLPSWGSYPAIGCTRRARDARCTRLLNISSNLVPAIRMSSRIDQVKHKLHSASRNEHAAIRAILRPFLSIRRHVRSADCAIHRPACHPLESRPIAREATNSECFVSRSAVHG